MPMSLKLPFSREGNQSVLVKKVLLKEPVANRKSALRIKLLTPPKILISIRGGQNLSFQWIICQEELRSSKMETKAKRKILKEMKILRKCKRISVNL